ncbi:hypothetical protein WDV93_04535 [Pantoea ananatis]
MGTLYQKLAIMAIAVRAGLRFIWGTHFSILARMRQEGALWLGAAICCDDCDIKEFTQCARPGTWVCSSTPGYRELLQRSVDIAWRVMYRNSNNWADYFDERGRYLPRRLEKLLCEINTVINYL